MPHLAAGGDLEAVGVPRHGAQHREIGVRLDRVEDLDLAGDGVERARVGRAIIFM
jgi:hypothetical protein